MHCTRHNHVFSHRLTFKSVDGKFLCIVIFISLGIRTFILGYGSVPGKKIFLSSYCGSDGTNAAWIYFIYILLYERQYIYIIVDSVCQNNEMAGISFHPQQDTARERPHLDVVLDDQYLFLKGTGPDVDPTTLRGHVRLVLTEPTSIKEITLQFKGKAKIPSNSYTTFSSHLFKC